MRDDLLQIFRVQRIEDVEEIFSRWALVLGVYRRKESEEVGVLLQLWPESLDSDLVVLGHVDVVDIRLLQELLLAGENLFEEVLVDGSCLWQIELYCKDVS